MLHELHSPHLYLLKIQQIADRHKSLRLLPHHQMLVFDTTIFDTTILQNESDARNNAKYYGAIDELGRRRPPALV